MEKKYRFSLLRKLMSSLYFIFENISTVSNVLEVSCSMKNDKLILDTYRKPTQSLFAMILFCH